MVIRLKIAINQEEYSGLLELAISELRNPESQLHFILRKELLCQGLISDQSTIEIPNVDIAKLPEGERRKGHE